MRHVFSLLCERPLGNLLLVVVRQALVSPGAQPRGREGLDWRPRNLLEKPSRLIIARSHPGSPLARIWPFRVIVIGCRAQSLLDYLPGYLGAP